MENVKNSFAQSLDEGEKIEEVVLHLLQKQWPSAVKIPGKFKPYDIWIPEISKSIEVKSCPQCHDYKRVVIEIEMFGKPSGILHSKADYWVIYDGLKYYIMTKNDILHCIFMCKLTYGPFTGPGDNAEKKALFVPTDKLFKYGKELQ